MGKNETLIKLRHERRLTQRQVAEAVGISRQYLGMIESGRRTGTLQVLHRIASFYGVTIDSLFAPMRDTKRGVSGSDDPACQDEQQTA